MAPVSYHLRLFIAGRSAASLLAEENLRTLCDSELRGRCTLDVIDVLQRPELAEQAHILATPTLVKQAPAPQRKVIGDLSNRDNLLLALDIPRVSEHDSRKSTDTMKSRSTKAYRS